MPLPHQRLPAPILPRRPILPVAPSFRRLRRIIPTPRPESMTRGLVASLITAMIKAAVNKIPERIKEYKP
jgi:hypothetical protein